MTGSEILDAVYVISMIVISLLTVAFCLPAAFWFLLIVYGSYAITHFWKKYNVSSVPTKY